MRTPVSFGRWLLLDRVAIGGMAEVYVAIRQDASPPKLHALKRLLPTLAEDGEFLAMFLDEARLVVQLDHPGVVPIHELGKHGEAYYMAMDYVAGRDLRAVLERARACEERLPVSLAAYVAWRVADALDHAHRKRDGRGRPLQVVHRDVSPANVLLGFDGSVRVIDFGIAQAAIRTRHEETALRGKFGYMSPEMARGAAVDRRSDVFALGVVLHEMLTGERLFTGPSELAVLEAVRRAEAAPPSRLNPSVPPALDAVVLRALAREPVDRFAWASELRDAIAPFTHHGGVVGDPPALARHMAGAFPVELRAELDRMDRVRRTSAAPPAEPSPGEPTQIIALRGGPAEPPEVSPRWRRVRGAVLATAAAACVVLAASIVLAATQPDAPPPALPPPALEAPRPPAPPPAALVPGLTALPPRAGFGRLAIQPRSAATLTVDGIPRFPDLAAGELRVLELPTGGHRVELRTGDGRHTGATVNLREGEVADLLGVELQ